MVVTRRLLPCIVVYEELQSTVDALNRFNADHCIILSCTKSFRVLFEGRKSFKKIKPQDVTYNGPFIPSSSYVKFLGITFDSALNSNAHFRSVATLSHHLFPKMNSSYGPSTCTLIRLYKSHICAMFDYSVPATYIASPVYNVYGRGYKHNLSHKHFPSHLSPTTIENGSMLAFHPSMTETST